MGGGDKCYTPVFLCYRNTFVLEYCGEVLDHKEFKARVKEYARSKNIHYYFMALKNNEVSLVMEMSSWIDFGGLLAGGLFHFGIKALERRMQSWRMV